MDALQSFASNTSINAMEHSMLSEKHMESRNKQKFNKCRERVCQLDQIRLMSAVYQPHLCAVCVFYQPYSCPIYFIYVDNTELFLQRKPVIFQPQVERSVQPQPIWTQNMTQCFAWWCNCMKPNSVMCWWFTHLCRTARGRLLHTALTSGWKKYSKN